MISQQTIKMTIDGKDAFLFDSSRIQFLNNSQNTFIGLQSGENTTTGLGNTFLGWYSGRDHLSGSANTFLGSSAGREIISGSSNTFVGSNAGGQSTGGGSDNTFLGAFAGALLTTGARNVYIGRNTGFANKIGFDNVAIGYNAGTTRDSTSCSVYIGFRAGNFETASNRLYIENSESGTPLIYGEFDNDILRINGELHIKNEYKFPLSKGADGEILKTDALGQLTWQQDNVTDADANPFNELQSLSTSNDSIFISSGSGVKLPTPSSLVDGDADTKIEFIENGPTDFMTFTIDGKQTLEIDSNGIGIGATSPSHWLTVKSTDDIETMRLIGPYGAFGFGARLNFGDADLVYIEEATDDAMTIHAADTITLDAGQVITSSHLDVTGTISKGGGSFKIDHPLDPENKYLYHSFVESPDMMNIYNGVAVLDENGEAQIVLPDWFGALNSDYRYQLTAIGRPGPNLYIGQEVVENIFRIAGGASQMKVSWQVTGIRQDAFANANRIPVEVTKNSSQRGKYLHPAAFGHNADAGIRYNPEHETKK